MPHKLSWAICVCNPRYEASLEPRKLYETLGDPEAEADGDIRVIDEIGEDYLYPASWFEAVDLPEATSKRVLSAS